MVESKGKWVAEAQKLFDAGGKDEACKLLLDAGFVDQLDAEAQSAFRALIPTPSAVKKALAGLLAPLSAPQPEARREAIKAVAKEVSRAWHKDVAAWASDPRALDPILPLATSSDSKTTQFAASAMVRIFERYLADRRIPVALMPALRARSPEARAFAATGVLLGGEVEHWSSVTPLLHDGSALVRAEALRAVTRWGRARLPSSLQDELRPLVEARFDDADPGVQQAAFTAARAVGDLHTAQLLTAKRPSIHAPVLLESLDLAIATISRA
jgi:hypothetical protein